MPTAYLEKLHKEGHGTVKHLEHNWQIAKQQAAKQGHAGDYAYITGIFNKMEGKKNPHPGGK